MPFSFTPVSIAHPSRDRALSQQQFISFYQTSQTKAHSPLPSNSSITIQRAHLRGQGLSSSHSAFLLASNSESLQPHPSREWLFPAVTTFKRLGDCPSCTSVTSLTFFTFAVIVVQPLSHVQLFATPWTAAHQALLSFTISWSSLRFMSIECDAI